jgi:hypothetical protein
VEEVVKGRRDGGHRVVDRQAVVDSVVGRYADRLRYMAEGVESVEMMQGEVNGLLNAHIDYGVEDEGYQAAMGRCAWFHTQGVIPETEEDELILTAIEAVAGSICSALFEVRKLVVQDPQPDDGSVSSAKRTLRGLMDKLKWTRWKECVACAFDELCFVPLWPFGDKESYDRPNCRNATSLDKGWWGEDSHYWEPMPNLVPPPESVRDEGPGEL